MRRRQGRAGARVLRGFNYDSCRRTPTGKTYMHLFAGRGFCRGAARLQDPRMATSTVDKTRSRQSLLNIKPTLCRLIIGRPYGLGLAGIMPLGEFGDQRGGLGHTIGVAGF
jgi:hypothetical protein